MITLDFEKYYSMENGDEAKDEFDAEIGQRLLDVGKMYLEGVENKGLRYVNIADLFSPSAIVISKFPTRGIMFRTDELEDAFRLVFPTKGIDEILFGKPHAMALPVMAEYFLSCTAEITDADMLLLELFMKNLATEKMTPTERCRALFSDRRKESYVKPPFRIFYVKRRVGYLKAGTSEIDSNLKNAVKMSLYLDCSMDYLASQSCEHAVFYRENDPQKTPISEKEQHLLSLFFPLSEESKIRACARAASFAVVKKGKESRRQKIRAKKEELRLSKQAEQPVAQFAEQVDDDVCERFAEWSGNLDKKGLLMFCRVPRSRQEIVEHLNIASKEYALLRYLSPLVELGAIRRTMQGKPTSSKQKFVTVSRTELRRLMSEEYKPKADQKIENLQKNL